MLLAGINIFDIETNPLLTTLHREIGLSDAAEPEYVDDGPENPELMILFLPSSIPLSDLKENGLDYLAKQEMELRKGQANEALEDLRLAIGHKALLFRTQVRSSSSTKQKTRAWDEVKRADAEVNKHRRRYMLARKAMVSLGADEDLLETYKIIQDSDLDVSKDITEENRFGQRNDVMAWFWRIGGQQQPSGQWMEECKLNVLGSCSETLTTNGSLSGQLVKSQSSI